MSISRDIRVWMNGIYGALIRLILINTIVFLTVNILVSAKEMGGNQFAYESVSDFTDIPADLHHLVQRFWTPLSYMFVHYSFGHFISNMLWLYFLGRIFCELMGSQKMTGVYLLGGLCGALLFVIVSNLLPGMRDSRLEGASAGVMAIVVAVATYSPDYRLHIRFPWFMPIFDFMIALKWVALIAFVLTSVLDLSVNTGGKVAHIGGAAFGFVYGLQFRRRKNFLEFLTNPFRMKKRSPLRVEHSRSATASDQLYNQNKAAIRRRVDEILDKISRSGYDSLTRDEKDFLQKNHDKF